jgi:ABC-type dipeptide/oligopeptide/nickel transport system permease component
MLGRTLLRLGLELASLALLLVVLTALVSVPNRSAWQPVATDDGATTYRLNIDTEGFKRNFTGYLGRLLEGDLGTSKNHRHEPVSKLVLQGAGYTLGLLAICLVIALGLGILKGIADFRRLSRPGFGIGPLFTAVTQGLPDFWLVLLLQWLAIFAAKSAGWILFPFVWDYNQPVQSLILPVIVMTLIPMGAIARVTANALAEVEGADFIRTARAKGLAEWAVQTRHALRPVVGRLLDAMPGVLTMMLSNLAIVEWLTGYPGLIRYLLTGVMPPKGGPGAFSNPYLVFEMDIPIVVASGVFLALLFIVMYEALRLLKGLFDPRLKGGSAH